MFIFLGLRVDVCGCFHSTYRITHIYIYIILYDHTYCWFTTLGWHFFGETNSLYKEDERF